MSTDTDGSEDARPPTAPTSPRESRREPAVIDATAEPVAAEGVADPREEEPQEAEEPPGPAARPPRPAPAAAPRGILPWVALGLAVVALIVALGAGAHLLVTTDGAIVDLRATSAKLQSQVAGLDQNNSAATGDAGALAALEQRVTALEATSKQAAANLASLQSETQKAVSLAEAPPAAAPPVDLGPLEQRIAGLEARLQPLAGGVASLQAQVQPLAATVAASTASVSANQDIVRKAVSSSDAAALVVVSQSLLAALDRGGPFVSDVAAAQALGADNSRIAALQPLAAKGVPTAATLAKSFAPLAAPILTGAEQKEPQGLLDRLERQASSLVQVRTVGDAAATSSAPVALIARIEGALAQGDVVGAVAVWDQLPESAKKVTGDWASAAKARAAADTAAHALLADAIDRLGRSKS